MAILIRALFFFFFVIHVNVSWGCSCYGYASFCEQVGNYLSYDSSSVLVVRAKVRKISAREDPWGRRRIVTLQILESFHNPHSHSTIHIREGNGADCGRSLQDYEKGDELIFAVWINSDTSIVSQFSICAPEPLRVRENKVSGKIRNAEDQKMTLSQFRKLNQCITSPLTIDIFPNPAYDQIHLRYLRNNKVPETTDVAIYDLRGTLIYKTTFRNDGSDMNTIAVSQWPSGLYIVRVKDANSVSTTSIMVSGVKA